MYDNIRVTLDYYQDHNGDWHPMAYARGLSKKQDTILQSGTRVSTSRSA